MMRIQVTRPGIISRARTLRETRFFGWSCAASEGSTGSATDESRTEASLTRVDRRHPVPERAQPPSYSVEVGAADLPRNRSNVARANRPVVHRCDRRNLRACAAQEDFVGDVELSPVDLAFLDRDLEVLGDFEDASARDAFEDVVADRRSDQDPVADHEQVLGRL